MATAVFSPQIGGPTTGTGMFGNFFGQTISPYFAPVAQPVSNQILTSVQEGTSNLVPATDNVTGGGGPAYLGNNPVPLDFGSRPVAPGVLQPAFNPITPTSIPGGTGDIVAGLPAARGQASGDSRIDPALRPYLDIGLRRAEQLFLGQPQPTLYPGQMFVGPSLQTEQALQMQEQAATAAAPILTAGQQAYLQSLGQIGATAAGGFLGGSPYREALIQAATRPLVQQYTESVMPTIASGFSRAGRYGSGAMEQAQARATEAFGRSLGDVAATLAAQDYARERGLQQQAQLAQSALGQAAPSFFQSSFLPSQALAQIGAAREQIAQQPLSEAIQRYQFSQQLPYQQLQGFLSSVYGTPMATSQFQPIPQAQTNRLGSALGGAGLGYLGGQFLSQPSFLGATTFGLPTSVVGAGLGAVLGGLL